MHDMKILCVIEICGVVFFAFLRISDRDDLTFAQHVFLHIYCQSGKSPIQELFVGAKVVSHLSSSFHSSLALMQLGFGAVRFSLVLKDVVNKM